MGIFGIFHPISSAVLYTRAVKKEPFVKSLVGIIFSVRPKMYMLVLGAICFCLTESVVCFFVFFFAKEIFSTRVFSLEKCFFKKVAVFLNKNSIGYLKNFG